MIRPNLSVAGAIALGLIAFYIARFCIAGLRPGECGFDATDWIRELDPAIAAEVHR